MVYSNFIKVMPDPLAQRSPDFDPEGEYYTMDEIEDMQAEEADRLWKEEREERAYARNYSD